MDVTTRREWEKEIKLSGIPATYDKLISFLQTSVETLKTLESSRSAARQIESRSKSSRDRAGATTVLSTAQDLESCKACCGNHSLSQCNDFCRMDTSRRLQIATKARLCYNCLRTGHSARVCLSKGRCRQCEQRHHSLLHFVSDRKRSSNSQTLDEPPAKKSRGVAPVVSDGPSGKGPSA